MSPPALFPQRPCPWRLVIIDRVRPRAGGGARRRPDPAGPRRDVRRLLRRASPRGTRAPGVPPDGPGVASSPMDPTTKSRWYTSHKPLPPERSEPARLIAMLAGDNDAVKN
jgi:hypothetical protein